MTETIKGMTSMPKEAKKIASPGAVERAAVRELVRAARARGEDLTGPDGLLKSITRQVLESALQEEMTEHLIWSGRLSSGRVRRPSRLLGAGASWLRQAPWVSVSLATRGQTDMRGLVTAGRSCSAGAVPRV